MRAAASLPSTVTNSLMGYLKGVREEPAIQRPKGPAPGGRSAGMPGYAVRSCGGRRPSLGRWTHRSHRHEVGGTNGPGQRKVLRLASEAKEVIEMTARIEPEEMVALDSPLAEFFRTLSGPWPFRPLLALTP